MKNILVPTDFSENSINALKYARELYSDISCNFYVLYVGTILDQNKDVGNPIELENDEGPNTKDQLIDLVDETRNQNTTIGHHFYALHEYGFFVPTIKKYVEGHRIDLIVMGTKGASGLKEKVVGSHAGDVITKIQCNTLVIPNKAPIKKPIEIAFPSDFNMFYSHPILRSMTELLELGNGSLRIMNVVQNGDELTTEQEANKEFLLDYLEVSFPNRYSVHSLSNQSVKSAIQYYVESRDVDMMVMVAKNLNFIQQILFDSLVEQISFHTKIPFFVIHK
jgi:nucleotide-binding universal stress UspA family protein